MSTTEFPDARAMPVDLRSDTVTTPTPAMRRAMAEAVVGDDVKGEDPTVRRLEETVAERLGFDAGMFVPSGTQSNLCALLAHCQRGDEYLVGRTMHTYKFEGGGAAALGGIVPCPLPELPDGTLDLDLVLRSIKPDDPHFPRSRLICLENTHNARVLPVDAVDATIETAHENGLAIHLDGARLWNAAVELELPAARLARGFDSVSVCLSKGLGAPVGSVLVGDAGLIAAARRWRKMLGGGMRQAGVLAAAGLVALEEGVARLADDHRRTRLLAAGLAELPGVEIRWADTNMVFVRVDEERGAELRRTLLEAGVLADVDAGALRLVLHHQVSDAGVERTLEAFRAFASGDPVVAGAPA